jgi:hypothetical protein
MSAQTPCRQCDVLRSETWRLAQRLADAERRIEHLAQGLDRLAALVQALRRELAPGAPGIVTAKKRRRPP